MKRLQAASCAATLFALVASFGVNADVTCLKNHYILDFGDTPWIATGSLNVPRSLHTATLLPDGRVLVAGGRGAGPGALDSAELYDPVSGKWSVTGSLVKPRVMHTATLLTNGKVLVVGGDTSAAPPDFGRGNTAELYDPATGTWTLTGSMSTPRRVGERSDPARGMRGDGAASRRASWRQDIHDRQPHTGPGRKHLQQRQIRQ